MPSNYAQGSKVLYNVDFVFCVDVTSGNSGMIEMLRSKAPHFYEDLISESENSYGGRRSFRVRVRLICFRDYIADGANAMLTTNFFKLPEEKDLFEKAVRGITAQGGGDDPEDGLEALAYAIRSHWEKNDQQQAAIKRRQVIVLWTDEEAHDLGFGKTAANYPREYMAKDFSELTSWWENDDYIGSGSKRLLLFAPNTPNWRKISENWDNVLHFNNSVFDMPLNEVYDRFIQNIGHVLFMS